MKSALSILVTLILIGVVGWSIYSYYQTGVANGLVDQANEAVTTGNDLSQQAGPKLEQLFSEESLAAFPGNREQLSKLGDEVSQLLTKAAEQYDQASEKFDQAAKKGVQKNVAEYWKLHTQQFQKFSQAKRAFAAIALLVKDTNLNDAAALNAKMEEDLKGAVALNDEAQKLADQADAVQKANPDDFK